MNKNIKVREYYDNYSYYYDSFYSKLQIAKFNYFINYYNEKQWCADLGGGSGLFLEFIEFPCLILDISFKMLYMAKQKKLDAILIAGDLSKLPFRTNSLNIVFSFTALQNMQYPNLGIKEIVRVLEHKSISIITILKKIIDNNKIHEIFYGYNFEVIGDVEEDIGIILHADS